MIDVSEAKAIIARQCVQMPTVQMPLDKTLGRVLAEDVFSPVNMPSFVQSSMDGYAFLYSDWQQEKLLQLDGEMQAGTNTARTLLPGKAVRIFTGAPLPEGADTVVMQEHTVVTDGYLQINSPLLKAGTNVRLKGSEIAVGDIALFKGATITPAAIGFLAGLGFVIIPVFAAPKVAVICTGKELQTPGKPLAFGQVYESNGITLKTALQQLHITDTTIQYVDDDLLLLTETVRAALQETDLLLITGGVSVGDYDYVIKAMEACNVQQHFHKIKQKPGKPLYFGTIGKTTVFGLPGNPASVTVCFYQYVTAALQKMGCCPASATKTVYLPIDKMYTKPAGITHFLKASAGADSVALLTAQESFRLSSFATANALIEIPPAVEMVEKGTQVMVHLLPE